MNPTLSFVILNYRTKELVREFLTNLYRANLSLSFEAIVVDNGRDCRLEELLEERFPRVRYFPLARNIGCAAGNNVGMRVTRGTYVIISNADITIIPRSIEALYIHMEAHRTIGMIAPRLMNPDGTIQESVYRFYRPLTPLYRRLWIGRLPFAQRHLDYFLMRDRPLDDVSDVDSLMGAFLFVRRAAIDEVGLFDERFFLYFSDTDWCMRFWRSGWRVAYHPKAHIIHLHKRDSARRLGLSSLFDPYTRTHIKDGIRYFYKYRHGYGRTSCAASTT